MKYRISTQSGRYYEINERSQILRLDVPFTPSDNWTCVGFREILPFNNRGPIITPARLLERSENGWTRFKNGNGRFVLVDYDHGTIREWGDRIISIWGEV